MKVINITAIWQKTKKKNIYFETRGMTAINLFGKCICPCV